MSNTIIGAPFEPRPSASSVLVDQMPGDEPQSMSSRGIFKIRAANSSGQHSSARILVNRMYAARGYRSSTAMVNEPVNRITLVANDKEAVIGTLSLSFDGSDGLLVDSVFPQEADALRRNGKSLCEFTKLAVDTDARSRRVLASLFHVAYIFAHRLNGCHVLLIEVNPRHVRYYQRMLGFDVVGSERPNPRVNAPAVLLCLDFRHAQEQIGRLAGRPGAAKGDRSLYPYFFSIEEEAGIVGRLSGAEGA